MFKSNTYGFAISTWAEDVIRSAAEELSRSELARAVRAGYMKNDYTITRKGWNKLNEDLIRLETNALSWLKAKFYGAEDHGHNDYGELVGSVWFDEKDPEQTELIDLGELERIDMIDTSFGDLADSVWKGVSWFGQGLLGGQINFYQ